MAYLSLTIIVCILLIYGELEGPIAYRGHGKCH